MCICTLCYLKIWTLMCSIFEKVKWALIIARSLRMFCFITQLSGGIKSFRSHSKLFKTAKVWTNCLLLILIGISHGREYDLAIVRGPFVGTLARPAQIAPSWSVSILVQALALRSTPPYTDCSHIVTSDRFAMIASVLEMCANPFLGVTGSSLN